MIVTKELLLNRAIKHFNELNTKESNLQPGEFDILLLATAVISHVENVDTNELYEYDGKVYTRRV
jgi:hypothetical protein